jgi:Na+/H+-translocating membrane pyrophosphatase
MIGKKMVAFAFGVSTVAIGTKINSVIYGKGSEAGLALMGEELPQL